MSATPEQPTWVTVLFDWQNLYNCAREAFGLQQVPRSGNVDPLKLARHLASGDGRQLQELRIYRGRPDNAKNPRGYSAWRSQTSAWASACGGLLTERYRDLRYRGGEIVEKGIDVSLAVDLVRLAMENGATGQVVVFSSDTDLVPAVELAVELRGEAFVEVAGWTGPHPSAALLDVAGARKLPLDRRIYDRVEDPTDYSVSARSRRKSGWDAQIQAEGRRRKNH